MDFTKTLSIKPVEFKKRDKSEIYLKGKQTYSSNNFLNKDFTINIPQYYNINYTQIITQINSLAKVEQNRLLIYNYGNMKRDLIEYERNITYIIEFQPKPIFRHIKQTILITTENEFYLYGSSDNVHLNLIYKIRGSGENIAKIKIFNGRIFIGYRDGIITELLYDEVTFTLYNYNYTLKEILFSLFKKNTFSLIDFILIDEYVVQLSADRLILFENGYVIHQLHLQSDYCTIYAEDNIFALLDKYGSKTFYCVENNTITYLTNMNFDKHIDSRYNFIADRYKILYFGRTAYFTNLNESHIYNFDSGFSIENLMEFSFSTEISTVAINYETGRIYILCKDALHIYANKSFYEMFNYAENNLSYLKQFGERKITHITLDILSRDRNPILLGDIEKYLMEWIFFQLENLLQKNISDFSFTDFKELEIINRKMKILLKKLRIIQRETMKNSIAIKDCEYFISTMNFIFLIKDYRLPRSEMLLNIFESNEYKKEVIRYLIDKNVNILEKVAKECKELMPVSDIYYAMGINKLRSYKNKKDLELAVGYFKRAEQDNETIIHNLIEKKYYTGAMELLNKRASKENIEKVLKCEGAIQMGLRRSRLFTYKIFDIINEISYLNIKYSNCICCEYENKMINILLNKDIMNNMYFYDYIKELYCNSEIKTEYNLLWKYLILKNQYAEGIEILLEVIEKKLKSTVEKLDYLKITLAFRKDPSLEIKYKLTEIQYQVEERTGKHFTILLDCSILYNEYIRKLNYHDLALRIIDMANEVPENILYEHWTAFIRTNIDNIRIIDSLQLKNTTLNLNVLTLVFLNLINELEDIDLWEYNICMLFHRLGFVEDEIIFAINKIISENDDLENKNLRRIINNMIRDMYGDSQLLFK